MRPIVTLLLPLAATAVIAAGCGSDDNGGTTTGAAATTPAAPAETTTTPSTTGSTAAGETLVIKMQNIAFDPKEATAKVGDKVEWENEDTVDHNVVATSGEDFKSENFGQGGKFDYTVDKPGTIKYVCTLHPGMEGTLTVTK